MLHWLLRKKLFIALPYFGNLSLAIRTYLQNSINKNVSFCKIKVAFKSTIFLSKLSCYKDKVPFNLRCNVVYKLWCGICNASYYGETCQHLNIRVGEHSSVSHLTVKWSKAKTTTPLQSCSFPQRLQNFGK